MRALTILGALIAAAFSSPLVPKDQRGVPSPGRRAVQDSILISEVLDGLRGAAPLACELALGAIEGRFGWRAIDGAPDGSPETRDLAEWVGRQSLNDSTAVRPLRAALGDSDACVRRGAARLLGRVRHPKARTSLLEALGSQDGGMRELAAIALGYSRDKSIVEPLFARLQDQVPAVRAAAAWALGQIGDRRAVQPLARILSTDREAGVRRAAALALGEMF